MDIKIVRDRRFMEMITELATEHKPGDRFRTNAKLCAVITVKNKPVAIGFNSDKTHTFQARFAKNEDAIFRHAETDCILQALREISADDLRRATIYIGRVKGNNNSWGLAKPCAGCMRAILHYEIKRVVYSLDETGEFEEMDMSVFSTAKNF